MRYLFLFLFVLGLYQAKAQELRLKNRKTNALTGTEFAKAIADSSLSLLARETRIYQEIKSGNVPDFLRKLKKIEDSLVLGPLQTLQLEYFVLPDYVAIGSNDDYFYVPMTPILAQRVATLLKCSLPTKQMVNQIYQQATIKLEPKPLPPNKAMTTVPIFLMHSKLVEAQLQTYLTVHQKGELTAGHKKDVIISNKIYGQSTPRVVIYGWHQLNGKPIQPVYNKHSHTWADYSHGIRLVQNKCWINGKKIQLKKILTNPLWSSLLSDEGPIKIAHYPIYKTY